MTRVERYLNLARNESYKSDRGRIRIGAVITLGNWVVAKGHNQNRSHPLQHYWNTKAGRESPEQKCPQHAEIAALVRSGQVDIGGAELFVYREDRRGRLAFSRPCEACDLAIRDAGIRRVYFTSPQGIGSVDVY